MTKTKEPVTPKKKRGAKQKWDYSTAQQFFVEGMPTDPDDPDGDRDWPNLRVLSERTGIPYERLRERSSKDRWAELKRGYQQTRAVERQKNRMEQLGKDAIEFDKQGLDIAKIGMRLVGVRMGEIASLVRIKAEARKDAEARLAAGQPVERQELWSAVRADELERLAKAAATLQEIGRRALGTDIEKVAIQGNISVEQTVQVGAELDRDDPDRLAAFMAAAERAGIWKQLELLEADTEEEVPDDDGIVEAELVEEGQ